MAWKLEDFFFCAKTYIETKSYKAVQTCFRIKFNFNTYPGKSQIFLWYRNFQTYDTANKRNKKLENAFRGRKLSARSVHNVKASKLSVGRSPKKSIQFRAHRCKNSLHRVVCKSCTQFPSTRWILAFLATFSYSFTRLKVTTSKEN